jgi:hypothetical protein
VAANGRDTRFMTLKRKDGSLNMTSIAAWLAVLSSVAICIDATPTLWSGVCKGVAPWTSLPAKVDAMKADLELIKDKLNIPQYSQRSTNSTIVTTR